MYQILIAEDEPQISSFVAKGLHAAGFGTRVVDSGSDAVLEASSGLFDLLVLDLGLPGMDGMEVLRHLRGRGDQLPVVVLTHRDAVSDRVAGLDLGADDYLTKPFSFSELLARVNARLRTRGQADSSTTSLRVGALELDLLRRVASLDGRQVELTNREFLLLEMFARHAGQVLSREQLLDRVWGYDFSPGSNVVDASVAAVRRKLGRDLLRTVRGAGYRLDA